LIGRSAEEVDVISREQHFRNEPMVQLARELHGDYKTALLSNIGRGFIVRLFTAKEREELFDAEILSNEVNLMKPDKAIYQLTASTLDVQPSECIMIDDLLINVEGAKAAGMHGILYESPEQTRQAVYRLLKGSHA
jgi:HAD superfamily hydrolase (TIGR01509 family)